MILIGTSILLLVCGSSAIPVEPRLDHLVAHVASNDVEMAASETMMGKVINNYVEDGSLVVQDGEEYLVTIVGGAILSIVEVFFYLAAESIETIKPTLISIVKEGSGEILTNLFSRDFEGLKATVRGMMKKSIVAFDDEMIRRILDNKALIQKEFKKIKDYSMEQVMKGINEVKDGIVKDIQDALLKFVDTITKKLLSIVGLDSGYKAKFLLPDFKKMLEKIKGIGPKLLGDVLNDRAFVDRELQRYKDALQDALPLMGKTAIVMLSKFFLIICKALRSCD